jgi:hypothetical protein
LCSVNCRPTLDLKFNAFGDMFTQSFDDLAANGEENSTVFEARV